MRRYHQRHSKIELQSRKSLVSVDSGAINQFKGTKFLKKINLPSLYSPTHNVRSKYSDVALKNSQQGESNPFIEKIVILK